MSVPARHPLSVPGHAGRSDRAANSRARCSGEYLLCQKSMSEPRPALSVASPDDAQPEANTFGAAAAAWLLVYVSLAYVLFRFFRADLSAWDAPGHLDLARFYRDEVWPRFHGWNPHQLGGYAFGYAYPSLFHWFVGGLGRHVDLELSFRLVVAGSLLALPLSIRSVMRALGASDRVALAGTLAVLWVLAAIGGPVGFGGTLYGTFSAGLIAAGFSLPFYFAYLAALIRGQRSRPHLFLAAALLALIVMSHAFLMIMAAVASLAIFAVFYLPQGRGAVVAYTLHGLLALGASAVTWLPFVTYGGHYGGWFMKEYAMFIIATHTIGGAIGSGLAVGSLYLGLRLRPVGFRPLVVLALATVAAYLSMSLLGSFKAFDRVSLHPYRFEPFIAVFAAMMIVVAFAEVDRFRLLVPVLCVGCAVQLVRGAREWFAYSRRTVSIDVEPLRAAGGRGLICNDRHGGLLTAKYLSPHLLVYEVLNRGIPLLNGLFVESSPLGSYLHSLSTDLSSTSFVWHSEPIVAPDADPQQRLPLLLRALGVGWVLSDQPLPQLRGLANATRSLDATISTDVGTDRERYFFYRLDNPWVEFAQPVAVPHGQRFREIANAWWIAPDPAHRPVLALPDGAPGPAGRATDEVTAEIKSATEVDVRITSDVPRWVVLKIAYFPSWHAEADGQAVPIYRAAPDVMAFRARGTVHVRFAPGRTERVALVLSAAVWLGLAGLWWAARRPPRRA